MYQVHTWGAAQLAGCVQGRPEVHKNKYVTDAPSFKLPLVLAAAAKGMACFDCHYYAAHNEDMPRSFDCLALFDHYINHGQFEGRSFKCSLTRFDKHCQRRSLLHVHRSLTALHRLLVELPCNLSVQPQG